MTKKEIALCKKLHELGVRKGIYYGDWYLQDNKFFLHNNRNIGELSKEYDGVLDFIPLWTWADAREWLEEKDYYFHLEYYGVNYQIITFQRKALSGAIREPAIRIQGKTDLEAILKCMVEVAEKGGRG